MSPTELAATVYLPPRAVDGWKLDRIVGHDRLRYYSLCRWALYEALRLAGAGPEKKVLFPEFFCRETTAPARLLGAEPAYYPVAPGLEPASNPRDWPQTCAVVAVNYFGFPQDLSPFREYCRRTGAWLIEDNAHGLFSRDASGAALGARAPLGVFSLRKTIPLPSGGALCINDASLINGASPQLEFTAQFTGRRSWLRRTAPVLGARGIWGVISAGRRLRELKGGAAIPPPDPQGESRLDEPREPCEELSRPIRLLDPNKEASRRRALYAFCEDLLAGTGITPVFTRLPEATVPYVYPFRGSAEQAARAEARLNSKGLFSLSWPDLPSSVAPRAPDHYRDVRGVQFLW